MIAVLVWWVVVAGVVLRLFPRSAIPRDGVVAGVLLAAFAGYTVLSIGWASDNGGAYEEGVRALAYAGVFALVVLGSPGGSGRAWFTGLAIGLTAVSAIALASRVFPGLFPDQGVVAALPETAGRLSYPLGYWNGLGATLALAAVLLIALAGTARSTLGRAAATAAIPMPALAVFLTSSRGASIALAVGLVLLFVFGRERLRMAVATAIGGVVAGALVLASTARDLFIDGRTGAVGFDNQAHEMLLLTLVLVAAALTFRALIDPIVERVEVPRRMTVGVSIAAGLILAAGLVVVNPLERWDQLKAPPKLDNPDTRGLTTSHLASTEGTGRYQFWHAGWTAFKSAPAVGIGAAGYESWWAQHGSLDYFVRNAHSLPIEVAAELGVVGLLLLFGFFGAVTYAGVRTRRSTWGSDEAALAAAGLAVLGAGLAAAAVEWTWEIPGAFVPVIVVAGVLAGPALSHRRRALVSRRSVPLAVGVALVGVVCVVAGAINLASDSKLRASQEAARDGDFAKAADDARASRKIEPWAAAPRVQEALVQEPGNVRAASQTIDGALKRSDEDWRIWLVATRLRSKAGDRKGASEALHRARALAPPSPILETVLHPRGIR